MAKDNLIGMQFGRLLVIRQAPSRRGRAMWHCACECGETAIVLAKYLKSGSTSSCGCVRRERGRTMFLTHGMTKTRLYRIWTDMIRRCEDPRRAAYKDYGGRGIRVCDRWKNSFEDFVADVGAPPSSQHTLDRFPDNDGNYAPSNARWATRRQQMNNRRGNTIIELDGVRDTIAGWARSSGTSRYRISERLRRGWNPRDAIYKPLRHRQSARQPTAN